MKKNNKGFSLVELIIVIAIMAVLVGVLAPQFIKYVESSRQSTDIQNIGEYKTAIETYVADNAPSGTIKITVTAGNPGTIACDKDLSSYGLPTAGGTLNMKSSGWKTNTYEYSADNFTWTVGTDSKNTKAPSKDAKEAFNK